MTNPTEQDIDAAIAGIYEIKLGDDLNVHSYAFKPEHKQTILAALQQHAKAVEWMPIETAPKDETLFRCRDINKPHVTGEPK